VTMEILASFQTRKK